MWQIINKLKNQQNWNKLGKNKITHLKTVAVHDTCVAVHDTCFAVHDTCVAVHGTCAKGKSKFKNMLENNILKFSGLY